MSIAQDPKSTPDSKLPTTEMQAVIFLSHAAEYIGELAPCNLPGRPSVVEHGTYDDRKAKQLLEAKSNLILAEEQIKSWFADLGFDGQCR